MGSVGGCVCGDLEVGEWKTWGELMREVKKNMVREIEKWLGV